MVASNEKVWRAYRAKFFVLGFSQAGPWCRTPLQAINEVPITVDRWNGVTLEGLTEKGVAHVIQSHEDYSAAVVYWSMPMAKVA